MINIYELVQAIKHCNAEIQKWSADKQVLEKQLSDALKHEFIDGSKTYNLDNHKVKITTGYNHSLNKKKYEELKDVINAAFDPVKKVEKYELNKKVIRDCHEYGSEQDRYLLSQFITSTEKKMHVSVEQVKNG